MLYLLYGSDFKKTRRKLSGLLDSLLAKKPEAEVFRVDAESFEAGQLEELIGGQGLFEKKYIVVLDKVFGDPEAKKEIISRLSDIKDSENIFILLEEEINKTELSKISKKAEKFQEFSSVLQKKKEKFNVFSLTEAFGKRDRKNLWILYQKAISEGEEPEKIHGVLFWQLKSMFLAVSSRNAKEAGMKEFVFNKSKGFARNYSEEELKKLSTDLVGLYHNSRRGITEFGTALERFILQI